MGGGGPFRLLKSHISVASWPIDKVLGATEAIKASRVIVKGHSYVDIYSSQP